MARLRITVGGDSRRPSAAKALRSLERKKYQYDLRTYGVAVRMRDVRAEEHRALMQRIVENFGRGGTE